MIYYYYYTIDVCSFVRFFASYYARCTLSMPPFSPPASFRTPLHIFVVCFFDDLYARA